jgi:5-(carboxyamino)imidazole ribonucleotide synthase
MSALVRPGAAVGVLGSGQLGRMFALAARRMGYRVHTFSPEEDTPTGQVADLEVTAPYNDLDAVQRFARGVSVVTFEFENIPLAAADVAASVCPVRPSPSVLQVTQHRLREKEFLQSHSLPVPQFVPVRSLADLKAGLSRLGNPAVLKQAASGYDGKGQARIASEDDAEAAWESIGGPEAILEAYVSFERELSVVAARGSDGAFVAYPTIENVHERHILDVSTAPARVPAGVAAEAERIARAVMEALDVVGVLCVEMFLIADGRLLVNELAPRPHNSGHLTIDAAPASQFEQQVRAVCGLPLGETGLRQPAAMANLLGDLWEEGEPDWPAVLARPGVALHLYGKTEARRGRKMGHLTALGTTPEEARQKVLAAREALTAGQASREGQARERVS